MPPTPEARSQALPQEQSRHMRDCFRPSAAAEELEIGVLPSGTEDLAISYTDKIDDEVSWSFRAVSAAFSRSAKDALIRD